MLSHRCWERMCADLYSTQPSTVWQSGRYQHSISKYFRFHLNKFHARSRLLSARRHHKSLTRGWREFSRDSLAIYTTIKAKQNVEGYKDDVDEEAGKSLGILLCVFIILAVELLCKWGMTAARSIKFIFFFRLRPFCTADVRGCVCGSVLWNVIMPAKSVYTKETNWV